MEYGELIKKAAEARMFSYAPYSHYNVGAALLCKDGKVFTGCNIENATFTPTTCAERTAFFKAISEGVKEFEALAIVGGKENEAPAFCAPCGVCRQVIAEFCDKDFKLILGTPEKYNVYLLDVILPFAFTPKELQ